MITNECFLLVGIHNLRKKNPFSIIFLEQSAREDGLKKQRSLTAYILHCQILHVSTIGYLSENIGAS